MRKHLGFLPSIILIILIAASLFIVPLVFSSPPAGISHMSGLHIEGSYATSTPAFMINQQGLGVIAEFRDNATPVAQFPNGGGLTINSGGLTVTSGGLTVNGGALIASGGLRLTAQSETVAAAWSITPAASYIVMTSSGAVASSTTAPLTTGAAVTGDVVVLRNGNAADTITVDGVGGTVECKADVVLGASDTLSLIYNGTEWNCLAVYDNS